MENQCREHKEEFYSYCYLCNKAYCINCYKEKKNCQNQNHKNSIVDYEIYFYGCCEKHFTKYVGGCTKCNRAWCISCITEGNDCNQKSHGHYISNYLQYKAKLDKSLMKYELIHEKPIKEHIYRIQQILKILKEETFQTEKNEENINNKFKSQVLQIFNELKSYNLKNHHNISQLLGKIFRCSLILRTAQKNIQNSQIKAKIFNNEKIQIVEKVSHSITKLEEIHNLLIKKIDNTRVDAKSNNKKNIERKKKI